MSSTAEKGDPFLAVVGVLEVWSRVTVGGGIQGPFRPQARWCRPVHRSDDTHHETIVHARHRQTSHLSGYGRGAAVGVTHSKGRHTQH